MMAGQKDDSADTGSNWEGQFETPHQSEGNEVAVEDEEIEFEDFQDIDLDAEVSFDDGQFDFDVEVYNEDGDVEDYEIVIEDSSDSNGQE